VHLSFSFKTTSLTKSIGSASCELIKRNKTAILKLLFYDRVANLYKKNVVFKVTKTVKRFR
jgi:hypothetical protein